MTVYYNGDFLPKEKVCISPDDRGFLFGDGVYEVACAYDGRLFRMEEHLQRLKCSLRAIRMAAPEVDVRAMFEELLRRNDLSERHAKVYLQVTRGAAPRQHAFPDDPVPPTVYAFAEPYAPPRDKWEQGVSVVTRPDERWARCDVKSTALLPNVLASQQASEDDAFETILVRGGVVTEGSHSTVLGVFGGAVMTHPLTNRVLPSVTREVALELCRAQDVTTFTFYAIRFMPSNHAPCSSVAESCNQSPSHVSKRQWNHARPPTPAGGISSPSRRLLTNSGANTLRMSSISSSRRTGAVLLQLLSKALSNSALAW